MGTQYYNNTDIVDLYVSSKVARNAYSTFKNDLIKLCKDKKELLAEINRINNEVFQRLSNLPLSKLFVSISDLESIFYRFSEIGKNSEFKLEVFLDYDVNDETDVESILHFYENNEKRFSRYGTFEEMYNVITKTCSLVEFPTFYSEDIYHSPDSLVKQYGPEFGLSYAPNPTVY